MNIPKTILDAHQTIMVIGLGGGFDVFTGLPFVYHWPDKQFVLVNSSPSGAFHYRESTSEDYPEGTINAPNVIAKYTVGRHGTMSFKRAYGEILTKHKLQGILTVDGGVDSLARGDEEFHGTVLEDFISLAALRDMRGGHIVHCCAGFGTETEEQMNHYRILENMANLITWRHFLGSFSLTQEMPEFYKYVNACESAWAEGRRKSHVQTKIISAVLGNFGDENHYAGVDPQLAHGIDSVFISPLSSIFWMFDMRGIVEKNPYLDVLAKGNTFADCKILFYNKLAELKTRRTKEVIPL